MKFSTILATCCIAGFAAMGSAQDLEFTEYLGKIPAQNTPLPLAADDLGNLYYGTFGGPASQLVVVEDPFTLIGTETPAGETIRTFTDFASGRGLQSIQITPDGTLFVAGDTGDATKANLWKFERSGLDPLTFSESFSFNTQVQTDSAKRRHGVALINSSGNGLIAAAHFTGIDYFDFNGNLLNAIGGGSNYMREPIYNSQDNIIYPLRNGEGSNNMIDYYFTNINTTDGSGSMLVSALGFIDDGAANGLFGNAAQNGYYFADQHQLITLDGPVTISGNSIPPRIRVWDIVENGTSVSLAYSIDMNNENESFAGLGDAVVINNRLYVSSTSQNEIYVYGPVNASVGRWEAYELY